MFRRLIYLNWSAFLARLTKLQLVLVVGYIVFLLILFSNLLGSALLVIMYEQAPQGFQELPWLTPAVRVLILIIFANAFWLLHFSFTSTRLLNMEMNRKLLAYGYPVNKLAWHLNLIGFFHPLNIIYNLTWTAFLLMQVQHPMYIPVVIAVVLLNYSIIYSIKHRFLHLVEKRFKLVVFSGLFIIFGTVSALAIIARDPGFMIARYLPDVQSLIQILTYFPGGLMMASATAEYDLITAAVIYGFSSLLVFLIFRDHFYKTKEGLLNPSRDKAKQERSPLWAFLKRWLGHNAGKFYYYIVTHPYNRLFLLTLVLVPAIYIPILLQLEKSWLTSVLIPTMLAAVPVALLAIGMANMFGYENRELLLHRQFPESFEKQLKERFLGVITVPLFIFYLITIGELIYLPQLGEVADIYIANTFFFLCFMLVFLFTSFYYYKKVSYSSFSFKHPIIPQKVTFLMTFLMFGLGYTIFIPIGEYNIYRRWVMVGLIIAISTYLWRNMQVLVRAFENHILEHVWADSE
ncbi:hypothetical protein NC796_09755 [Aliifodinibius sp. S!AR15-10]|uniref:hypothetical protein n=1 Tax=Aliifodinibius sp. S!AR15-10 TaxID=2950437 RepID=UPI0028555934|nr:hypothetical protein [Aliifodinibius sp. S!AR15-10]MDR8391423.1 hypothetical protein [Aliifodinibius sp. S!AR15-10]